MTENMDSELLLKFIWYFPDYLLALSCTLLRFFGQPLSKHLKRVSRSKVSKAYTIGKYGLYYHAKTLVTDRH